jgi:nucleoside-diphosphate-sugar epimerase
MIVVTGATGLSGSIVIREFARHKTPLRALVRNRARARALETLATVEFVEADMLRPETLGAALDGVDRVLMISSPDPQMVETQCTFIDASKKASVRHIVKFSGAESGVGFNPKAFRFTRMHRTNRAIPRRVWSCVDALASQPIHAGVFAGSADDCGRERTLSTHGKRQTRTGQYRGHREGRIRSTTQRRS